MTIYSVFDILFFFYIYAFLGWLYESILVSLKSRKPVNRGFVKGPLLPIYGLGASVILIATKPFVDYPIAVFFVGMATATIIEYAAGYILELIFKVRYWDYTGRFGNIRGYICLISVVMWGFFSNLMVYVIHEPVEELRNVVPDTILYVFLVVATVLFITDAVVAFKKAYDVKTLIVKVEQMRNNIIEIEQKLNFDEKREEFIAQISRHRKEVNDIINDIRQKRDKLQINHPRLDISKKHRKIIEDIKNRIKD